MAVNQQMNKGDKMAGDKKKEKKKEKKSYWKKEAKFQRSRWKKLVELHESLQSELERTRLDSVKKSQEIEGLEKEVKRLEGKVSLLEHDFVPIIVVLGLIIIVVLTIYGTIEFNNQLKHERLIELHQQGITIGESE